MTFTAGTRRCAGGVAVVRGRGRGRVDDVSETGSSAHETRKQTRIELPTGSLTPEIMMRKKNQVVVGSRICVCLVIILATLVSDLE